MPGIVEPGDQAQPAQMAPGFQVLHQEVDLEVDFVTQRLTGTTEMVILPMKKDLRSINLFCRQLEVHGVTVDKHSALLTHTDAYDYATIHHGYGVEQYHSLRKSLEDAETEDLEIQIPKQVRIREASAADSMEIANAALKDDSSPGFKTLTLRIEYSVKGSRDGVHWVGLGENDFRYPHVYTYTSSLPETSPCFVFPCVGTLNARCTWRLSITCPRLLGDITKPGLQATNERTNGDSNGANVHSNEGVESHGDLDLTPEEKNLEMAVIGSGLMEDSDAPFTGRESKRKFIFHCTTPVAPHHIGFVVGPFEEVDLAEFRESEEDQMLGQNAVGVHGFCLPGRADEVRNCCMPLPMCIDHFIRQFGSYPFKSESTSYKICFVDDLPRDVFDTATLSICSTRLLYPESVLDPIYPTTRELVHAVASQWIGVNIIPKTPQDYWLIVAASYFMADTFMQTLCGKNEYRFRQKLNANRVVELDIQRPSVYDLGPSLSIDATELEFMKLKAPLILFILHQRLIKASGRNGVNRIIWRIFLDAQVGRIDKNELDTEYFRRTSDKVGHAKLETFFNQWVYGAGCPIFDVSQRFNKKKLVIEMTISQVQGMHSAPGTRLEPDIFMREAKEEDRAVYAGPIQPLFTGPITIRIHEADGTPYEHIVDVKETTQKFEIPYNTKYKRLKRNRLQKERAAAAAGVDLAGESQEEVLLYCLGDVLQSEADVQEWKLADWSKEDEEVMNNESYEWIRVDADFEWIGRIHFGQPVYMYTSQLQQDTDVVAQMEAIQYLRGLKPTPQISTVLLRTLMDSRYYYGIRILAIEALSVCAVEELDWIGLFHLEKAFQEFFCFPDSPMTRSNDFSDRRMYFIQCAIPKALSRVRDMRGRTPSRIKRFFLEKLKFNDNSNNQYSDATYVAVLITCLAESLTDAHGEMNFGFEDADAEIAEADFLKAAMNEIDRYRRIDEWIPSYQNRYTTTALRALAKLIEAKVAPIPRAVFMPYVALGNSDVVRLEAFSCLVGLGFFTRNLFRNYLIFSYFSEPSPYMRSQLWKIIERALGMLALDRGSGAKESNPDADLVIVGDEAETAQEALTKVASIQGAKDMLCKKLVDNSALKDSIREALGSPVIGMDEFKDILYLCQLLYKPRNKLAVKLKLPRYLKAEHLGQAKLRFTRTDKFRTTPLPALSLPTVGLIAEAEPLIERKRIREANDFIKGEFPETKRQKTASDLTEARNPKATSEARPSISGNGLLIPPPTRPVLLSLSPQTPRFGPPKSPRRKIVKLRFPKKFEQVEAILRRPSANASKPAPTSGGRPSAPSSSAPPAPGKLKLKIKLNK
ncbi:hypothetical protein EJ06DRAFT_527544 [Trichodelitschia bisporula]|uniref:Transcription initiation factor TFIID subunit 2 n=1 Tax=Trichodelitschia bisporula TaxID=703511 RepID=A0A6G1I705_9PEZI|nr:hypothetical protein EJ06DRAFT_527544 [Trichodelitschia bisporula]